MENVKLLIKWTPIIKSILGVFDLENEVLIHISKWMESKSHEQNADINIAKVLKQYHDELIKNGNKLNIVKTYYSKLINKIVFELENGEIVYVDEKTYKFSDGKIVNEKIDLFDKLKY